MQRRHLLSRLGLGLASTSLALLPGLARAEFPDRAIKLIVPFPPGGPADNFGRILGNALAARLQQPVVVDNRGGVGGALGVQSVARAAPDGYTIGLAGSGATVFLPLMSTKLLFDNARDLTFLSRMVSTPNVFVVGPSVKAATIQELIAQAKAAPGRFTIASTGVGSSPHVLAEMFQQRTGVSMVHVPYKGAAPAVQELMAGQVDAFIGEMPGVLPYVQSGKVRALFTADQVRARWLPEVPSADESGLAGVALQGSYGLVGPAGLPAPIAQRLTAALGDALRSPELLARFDQQNGVADPSSGADYEAYVKAEQARWLPVIRKANISLD